MPQLRNFPSISLLFAPLLAIYLYVLLKFSEYEYRQTFLWLLFLLCNAYAALALNWPQLWQSAKRKTHWGFILSTLTLTFLIYIALERYWQNFFSNESVATLPLFFYFSLLCQLIIYLGMVYVESRSAFSPDSNLLLQFNRYLSHLSILAIFAALLGIILGLGFALLSLLGLALNTESSLIIFGLCLGALPVFLLLIPVQAKPYPFPYLFIFQWIALGFIGIYLLFALLRLDINIQSGVRLSMAGILWLLAIIAHDPHQPHQRLNLLTAAAGLILTLMSLYGIITRISTQGISEMRLSALFIALLLLLGFIGIALKALLKNKHWQQRCCTATLILMTACLFIFSLLPLPKWTLNAQTERYLSGAKTSQQLADDRYFFGRYGQAGEAALKQIAAHYQIDLDEENSIHTQQSKLNYALWKKTLPTDIDRYFHRIPADLVLPEILHEQLLQYLWDSSNYLAASEAFWQQQSPDKPLFIIAAVDADNNPNSPEWLVFRKSPYSKAENYESYHLRLAAPDASQNTLENDTGNLESNYLSIYDLENSAEKIIQQLEQGISYKQPRYLYRNLIIGTGENAMRIQLPRIEVEE